MKLGAALLATFSMLHAAHAHPAEVVNFDQANPPFMYAQDGRAVGLYPSLVAEAFRLMHVDVAFRALPWARAIQDMEQGNAAIAGIYKTPERERKYDYSDPIYVERLAVYTHKTSAGLISRIGDLRGKRVGVVRGWSYGPEFDDARKIHAIDVEEVAGDAQNFAKLNAGRLDAVVAIVEAGEPLLKLYPDIRPSPVLIASNPTYLAFSKSAAKKALIERFNSALRDMKRAGIIKASTPAKPTLRQPETR